MMRRTCTALGSLWRHSPTLLAAGPTRRAARPARSALPPIKVRSCTTGVGIANDGNGSLAGGDVTDLPSGVRRVVPNKYIAPPLSRSEDDYAETSVVKTKRRRKSGSKVVKAHELPDGHEDNSGSISTDSQSSVGSEEVNPSECAQNGTQTLLTNPFRGLHEFISRSYRLDQLQQNISSCDILFAQQQKKSTAFSFVRVQALPALYEQHWSTLPEICAQQESLLKASLGSKRRSAGALPRGAIPGLTLFNNDLGLDRQTIQTSLPLLFAQRLLLFPDNMRHFHTVCGRENVPCDFYADIDLPGESSAKGEMLLLEVLNYLEVRLPGIGFTDPFFLVLTNEVPSADKVSYHIHARSMTHVQERMHVDLTKLANAKGGRRRKTPAKDENAAEEEYDDLSDIVNAVEAGDPAMEKKRRKKLASATTQRLITFQDYRVVKLLADEVNQTLGRTVIDDACYRTHGMLRCAYSCKIKPSAEGDARGRVGSSGKPLVPLVSAKDPALRKKLQDMEAVLRTMADPEILELSFCNRFIDSADCERVVQQHVQSLLSTSSPRNVTVSKQLEELQRATLRQRLQLIRPKNILGPQGAQAQEYDAYGNLVSPFLTEGAKWKRYKGVVDKLRRLPPRSAESYDVWVRVGLALHNFSNEDHIFDEWVRFSLKCPQKYSREVCRKKWLQFERNPDALNWRRGYNYLNSTIWRQVS